ncbi:hypothetical protein FA13DRAFT_1737065 [Coprinellus micaceus]|uniref:Uncharacterized protein n=1 Tax=Coprinellus micaceus TaxID=71717 RepID=A0A4Y7SYE2_COPMI|nr:hypothetical protein FA13DRAFT_1737065 [Coprinellus micaceus]
MSGNGNQVANTAQPASSATPPTPTLAVVHLPGPSFHVTPTLENEYPALVINFSNRDVSAQILTPTQCQEPATNPPVLDIAIYIEDEVNSIRPLDDRPLVVFRRTAGTSTDRVDGVTSQEVVDAVRRRLTGKLGEIPDVAENPTQNSGSPPVRRIWGGLGQPDANGACTLRLLCPPAP